MADNTILIAKSDLKKKKFRAWDSEFTVYKNSDEESKGHPIMILDENFFAFIETDPLLSDDGRYLRFRPCNK